MVFRSIALVSAALAAASAGSTATQLSAADAVASALRDDVTDPGYYIVDLTTDVTMENGDVGVITLNVTEAWAPLGTAHLRELIEVCFVCAVCAV